MIFCIYIIMMLVIFENLCLHGSVATQFKCGGIFSNYRYFIANFPQYVPVKEFKKRLIFGEDMENDKVGRFLGHNVFAVLLLK